MKYSFKTFAIVVLLSFAIPEAIASEEDLITPPEGGNQIVAFDQDLPLQFQSQNVEATGRWAAAKDMPFKEVYRIESDTRFSDPKNMQLSIPLAVSIRKGDVLLLSFWVNRPRAGGQPNNIYLSIGDKDAPAIYENQLSAYRVWKQHVRSFIAPRDCDSTDAGHSFRFSAKPERLPKSPLCNSSTTALIAIRPRSLDRPSITQGVRQTLSGERKH